ncbi:hypothetical protein N7456_001663 [Penicillium angulare]|uniref:F-box domain-containing protein n=1 Tax=Penicillium angulare TaxID=116970 RepID=A0A9W9KNB4_9EURO|nr:hypothetical protein N7456_001663 [Penicillium angulare]
MLIVPVACTDPSIPILSLSNASQEGLVNTHPVFFQPSPILNLPVEIIEIILGFLPLPDLVCFLGSSKRLLEFTYPTFARSPSLSYTVGVERNQLPKAIHIISSRFLPVQLKGLEERNAVIIKMIEKSKYVKNLPANHSETSNVGYQNLEWLRNFTYGFRRLSVEIPFDSNTIRVHEIILGGVGYVSGVTFMGKTKAFLGRDYGSWHDIHSTNGNNMIQYAMDPFGIRSLKFGNSVWSSGDPETFSGYVGILMRDRASRLVLTCDVYHFPYAYHTSPIYIYSLLGSQSPTHQLVQKYIICREVAYERSTCLVLRGDQRRLLFPSLASDHSLGEFP